DPFQVVPIRAQDPKVIQEVLDAIQGSSSSYGPMSGYMGGPGGIYGGSGGQCGGGFQPKGGFGPRGLGAHVGSGRRQRLGCLGRPTGLGSGGGGRACGGAKRGKAAPVGKPPVTTKKGPGAELPPPGGLGGANYASQVWTAPPSPPAKLLSDSPTFREDART